MSGGTRRAGFSTPELLVALALLGLCAGALAGLLAATERLVRRHAARVLHAETVRIVGAVLGGELRALDPAADLAAVSADTVALRAFRGVAIVCGAAGDRILVRYAGARLPDPAKDSVLVATERGADAARALASAEAAEGCAARPGEAIQAWGVGAPLPPGSLLLLFERGSYHLAGGALRYRRGAAGRQPLTAETIDTRASALAALRVDTADAAPGGLAAILSPAPAPAVPAPAVRLRFVHLNRAPETGAAPSGEGS